ncbi:MAG: peptidylprolyl isomerase [Bacteroides sp.]|nr:peptidylprolyl isomerase [Bacteroides sp.]MCM1446991.1 peptidylprolyl isomerase [Bacteroides sp.]
MAVKVKIHTVEGDIVVRLYDETPLHRDNFLKLVGEGYYNGTLFHRVIKDFMIQGGDPDSIGAASGKMLGTGGPGYTIPAEILYPRYFHKRGALCAARLGDDMNPERVSSGSQFYIVWGQRYNAGQISQLEHQMQMQQEQAVFDGLVAEHRAQIMDLRRNRDRTGLQALQDKLNAETHAVCDGLEKPKFTQEQIEAYTTIGGTPHLDGQYTVFGEVEEGLDVVERIQSCATLRGDRPKFDISMTMEIC